MAQMILGHSLISHDGVWFGRDMHADAYTARLGRACVRTRACVDVYTTQSGRACVRTCTQRGQDARVCGRVHCAIGMHVCADACKGTWEAIINKELRICSTLFL